MRFTDDKIDFFFGKINRCYLGHTTSSKVREHCASGGIVSALLIDLLESGAIQSALVSRLEVEDGIFRPRSLIAQTREDILSCGGSIYADVSPVSLKTFRNFNGRIAVVGLPCYLKGIRSLCESDRCLKDKVFIRIGLFCGHNSKRELLMWVLQRKGIDLNAIERLRFREGRWRGRMVVHLKTGEAIKFPFSHFSIYQNLHLFSQKKCMHCTDHTAEQADISCGDAWLRELKNEPFRHSIVITRNRKGDDLLRQMEGRGRIRLASASPKDVFRSQKRSLIHHKSSGAKSKIGRIFGYRIEGSEAGLDRWNDRLSALISMSSIRWSESSRYKHMIFRIPRPVLFFYLLLFKGLTNF